MARGGRCTVSPPDFYAHGKDDRWCLLCTGLSDCPDQRLACAVVINDTQ